VALWAIIIVLLIALFNLFQQSSTHTLQAIVWWFPMLLVVAIWVFFLWRMRAGGWGTTAQPRTAKPRISRVTTQEVAEPPAGTWSNCLVVNGVGYVAGMVARGSDGLASGGDEYEQAKIVFAKIRHLLEAAGGRMSDVVKVTIFVTDIAQREKVWRARREVFSGDFPASTLVQVAALAEPGLKVEIEAIAHIGAGTR
jgi:enamine deaminase RidA (YjgF/YER057c/UK114 family)